MKIYHNPRCRKSRETLALIEQKGVAHEVVEYLKAPPSARELKNIIKMLDIDAFQLLRRGETVFKEKYKGKERSDDEWIKIMVENPVLIERPIVVKDAKAVIGRPPENVLELM